MSRARHAKKANGGEVKQVWEAGGETNAAKEAEERKRADESTVRVTLPRCARIGPSARGAAE